MIQVDISNIWGEVSLTDLLSVEAELSAAHMAVTQDGGACGWLELPDRFPTAEHMRLLAAAHQIRETSDVLVVIGSAEAQLGPRGIIELMQGPDRNVRRSKGDPLILWAGSDLSTYGRNELIRLLEGRDFSICAIAGAETRLETAVAFRDLRWMLERRCGTAQAKRRIYAVTDPERGALRQMAEEEGWESFRLPAGAPERYGVLSPAGLLPLAVAGVDCMALLRGTQTARKEMDLRSFENPVWLYAAIRSLMARRGKAVELLSAFEPGFGRLAGWHRLLFDRGPMSVFGELPGMESGVRAGRRELFETLLRFRPPVRRVRVWEDLRNPDGFEHLAGQYLDQVEAQVWSDTMTRHSDGGCPVVSIECGSVNEESMGTLIWFMQLAAALCAQLG